MGTFNTHRPLFIFRIPLIASGLLVIAGAGVLYGQSPTLFGCPAFPSDNIWNAKVDQLPVAANSAAYIKTIGATKGSHADFGSGTWKGAPIGIPYISVPGNQARVPVSFTWPAESDPGPYPIPPNPPIEGGSQSTGDRHILMVDRDQCVLYELFAASPNADGSWHAGSGARFDLRSNALRPAGWTSADAAGLPILPGLVRYDEVASGEIRHALRFTVPQTASSYVWPARHKASSLTGTQYPAMGQRFRLKASFDISGFSPQVQVILRALKTYGMILSDNGSAWFFSGAPDPRWNDDELAKFSAVKGSDFEAVDVSSLKLDSNSGQVPTQMGATLSLASTSVIGGSVISGNAVRLSAPALSGGAVISLTSSDMAAASVPASVTIPANATSVGFSITTSPVASSTPVTITAFYLGTPSTSTLKVDPGALTSVSSSATSATGPASVTGTVTLTGRVLGGAVVSLLSSNTNAISVPASVSVPSGALSATFPMSVKAVAQISPVTITASMGGVTRTVSVTVNPTLAAPIPAVLTFQQGTGGYTAGTSATITTRYAAASNGFNGYTYQSLLEYPLLSTDVSAATLLAFKQISLPSGKRVNSATLTLTVTAWTSGQLSISYIRAPWDTNFAGLGWIKSSETTDWSVPGAGGAGSDVLPGTITVPVRAVGEQVVNIPLDPAIVAGWMSNPTSNQGLRISAVAGGSVTMYSVRHSTIVKRPTLSVAIQ